MSQAASVGQSPLLQVNPSRLFGGSCVALTSSAMMFAIFADIIGPLKQQFLLSNEQIGWIASAGLGFTLAMFVLGPLCDALGMGLVIALAFLCHTLGLLMMIFAGGFWSLFWGNLVNAVGGGAIEAACNPLVATIYPASKTHKLNQFHMWFPGGIVIGGLLSHALTKIGLDSWQLKIAIVLLPTIAYGILFIGQTFPPTERVQSGVSFGGMVKETLFRPLFLLLLFCMMLTASLELGPQRWIPSVLAAGGIPGILVLVWITGLMAVLRFFAGPVVRTFGNTGVLLLSALLGGIGLLMLSFAGSTRMIGVAATIFALGVCYFWPTMLGTAAERVPKGGAMALAFLGGLGGLFVSIVTVPMMGKIADHYLHRELVFKGTVDAKPVDRQTQTLSVLREIDTAYTKWAQSLSSSKRDQITKDEIHAVLQAVQTILAKDAPLPQTATANALRIATKNGPGKDVQKAGTDAQKEALAAKNKAEGILNPAENKGGLISFRYVAPLSVILILVFGAMYIRDRKRGACPNPDDSLSP